MRGKPRDHGVLLGDDHGLGHVALSEKAHGGEVGTVLGKGDSDGRQEKHAGLCLEKFVKNVGGHGAIPCLMKVVQGKYSTVLLSSSRGTVDEIFHNNITRILDDFFDLGLDLG